MKKVLTLSLAAMVAFIIGCGSGSENSVVTGGDSSSSSSSATALLYDYNTDKSSAYLLSPSVVNQYEEVQKSLDNAKDNEGRFYSLLGSYITDLIRSSIPADTIPSYAPRGAINNLIVAVNNKTVDYSDYILKADIDFNSEVNFEDLKLLSSAILNGNDSFQYDVNRDGTVDTADIIYLFARLNSEIKFFDFYTTSGEKLNIPSRSVDATHTFTYTGSETKIMVVAKDINNVSGFETGLSDINEAWYKQTGWVLQSAPQRSTVTDDWDFNTLGNESIGQYLKDNAFLIGWKTSINEHSMSNAIAFQSFKEEPFASYLELMEQEIMLHFKDTDMNHPPERSIQNPNEIIDNSGAVYFHTYDYSVGIVSDSNPNTYLQMQNLTLSSAYILGEKSITIKHYYYWSMQAYMSLEENRLSGTIELTDITDKIEGTITGMRIGPDPKDAIYEGSITDNTFKLNDLVPFGAYLLTYTDECSCQRVLDEAYVFEDPTPLHYPLTVDKARVTLSLLDKEGEPISGKDILIMATACVDADFEEKSFDAITDADGKVIFENVPIGKYTVYVDNRENKEISFCETYSGTLSPELLWDIHIAYNGRSTNYTKDYKDIIIASISDDMNTWGSVIEWGKGEFPFPLPADDRNGILLTDTSWFSNYGENTMSYYPDGYPANRPPYLIKPGYCFITEELNELLINQGDTGIGCMDTAYTPSWDQIDTSLHTEQEKAFLEYRAFTIQDTGKWLNNAGTSTLTVRFTPAN